MGAFGRAIADVGKGLMERNARKREMEDLARIKAEEEQAAWDRDAPKRELEKQWSEQRIAASKAAAEASRMSAESTRLSAIAGSVKGGDRFYGQEVVDESGKTTFIPQREAITRTPDSVAADARARDSIAAKTAATQASRENTSAYRADQERSRLEAERRRVNEAAVDSAITVKSQERRGSAGKQMQQEALDSIEKARKAREAAIDEQILRLGSPKGLLSTAEQADDFSSSQEAASVLGQDPNVRVTFKHPDGSVTDTGPGSAPPAGGPKTQANKVPATAESYESVYAEAYAQFKSMPGISDDVAKAEAEKIAAPYKKAK